MSERGRETASDRGREGEWVQYVEKKNASEIVHLNRKVRNNVGKVWKGRALRLGSYPPSVFTGAERSVGDRLTAGASFIFLPVSPPPHPSIPSTASGHLSPSKVFVSLLQHTLLFYSFWSYVCLPSHPSLSLLLIDSGTAAQSGVRAFSYPATCLGFLALSCMLSHDTTETVTICIQSFSSFFFFLLLLWSLILSPYYLFFVIMMRLSHPLPLIFSAGYEEGPLCRARKSIVEQHYAVTKE